MNWDCTIRMYPSSERSLSPGQPGPALMRLLCGGARMNPTRVLSDISECLPLTLRDTFDPPFFNNKSVMHEANEANEANCHLFCVSCCFVILGRRLRLRRGSIIAIIHVGFDGVLELSLIIAALLFRRFLVFSPHLSTGSLIFDWRTSSCRLCLSAVVSRPPLNFPRSFASAGGSVYLGSFLSKLREATW